MYNFINFQSYGNRKRLLATNPNLFVSKTRLSVRGVPLHITDPQLKAEAKYAVIKFWRQVNSGDRKSLEPDEMDGLENGVKVQIKQAKMLKSDRLDPVTKKPRSKGLGFIEFERHSDALACLRYLNLNPKAFTHDSKTGAGAATTTAAKSRKPVIVEFAIENRLILKQREERNKRKKPHDVSADPGARKKVKSTKQKVIYIFSYFRMSLVIRTTLKKMM